MGRIMVHEGACCVIPGTVYSLLERKNSRKIKCLREFLQSAV
jgi:hypothetical protein